MVAAVLVDTDWVLLFGCVKKCIVAVEDFRIVELVELRQAHGREVVVTDHRLVGTVHDGLQGQLGRLDDFAQLLERQLVRRGGHREAVFLQELRGELVEEVEGKVGLHRQVRDAIREFQRTEVADHQAIRTDVTQLRKELLELAALTAHRRARRVDDDLGAAVRLRVGEDFGILLEFPRAQRSEGLAADVNRIGAVVNRGFGRLHRVDADRQSAVRGIFLLDVALLTQHFVLEARFLHGVAEETRLAFAREADVLFARLAERKRRREIARAVVVEILPAFFVRRVAVRVRNVRVNGLAVRRNDAADEVGRTHAALDFKREHAGLNELRDGSVHAHILERELVRAFAVLVEHFARIFVDELVRPAARLQAAAAVAALAEQHARVDALARLADAHIAVHEVLDLDARAFAEQAELGERHLAAHDDARDAVFLELLDGVLVVRVHHDRRVQRNGNPHLMHELEHGKILYEDGVGADFVEIGEVFAQRRDFLVADEVVQRDIKAHAVLMGVVDGLFECGIVKIKTAFVHAHVEMLAAEVNGVSTRLHASDEGIPRAGRREQFDGFAIQNHI